MPSKLLERIEMTVDDFPFGRKRTDFLYILTLDYVFNYNWVKLATVDRTLSDFEERSWFGFNLRVQRHMNHVLALADTFFDELSNRDIAEKLLLIVELGRFLEFDLKMSKRVGQSMVLAKVSRIKS